MFWREDYQIECALIAHDVFCERYNVTVAANGCGFKDGQMEA